MPQTRYHWLANLDCVMHETDENGDTTVEYTHEPLQYGPLLSDRKDGVDYVHHYDASGSTIGLLDDAGSATSEFTYDCWGVVILQSGLVNTPFAWLGRWGYYLHIASGLTIVRRRAYGPEIGRWQSQDPRNSKSGLFLGAATASVAIESLYGYCANSPVTQIDPSGLAGCKDHKVWDASLCSQCPPCKCSDVHGTELVGDTFPIQEFGANFVEEAKINCSVRMTMGKCGLPAGSGGSWTCAQGTRQYRRDIFICISDELDHCAAIELLRHELVHAKQLCTQPTGSSSLTGNCKDHETEAHNESCTIKMNNQCRGGPPNRTTWLPEHRVEFNNCVQGGLAFSCTNVFNGKPFTVKSCEDRIKEAFPS